MGPEPRGTRAKSGVDDNPAERRQLTVVFVDLVGATALADRLDPEIYRNVVREFQFTVAGVMSEFGGYIAQYLGDGMLVYFGYPQAYEDEARRAVLAGLRVLAAVRRLGDRLPLPDVKPAVRVSAHAGPVVTGEVGAGANREQLALGQAPNIAARLQALAEPDSMVVSSEVRAMAEDRFEWQALGEKVLKGVSQTVAVYRVLGERRQPFALSADMEQTPLVSRRRELQLLLRQFELVRGGRGQTVLITAGAGLGKSRLVRAFHRRIQKHEHSCWVAQCMSFERASALAPAIRLLQEILRLDSDETAEAKLSMLENRLAQARLTASAELSLFANLLSIPITDPSEPLELTPKKQKEATLEAVLALVTHLAEQAPLVLVFEDLHWADPSTLELVELLVDRCESLRLFLVLTGRGSFQPAWSDSQAARIFLAPLTRAETEALATGVTRGKKLPVPILRQILERTDGVPLFVEELTNALLECGRLVESDGRLETTSSETAQTLPSTLHGSLTARLDGLGTAKAVAQLGAVIGREFGFELLARISDENTASLQSDLARLIDAGLVLAHGEPPLARYRFKHALIQETAYELLLMSRRQACHRRVAEVVQAHFPHLATRQPELVAHHLTAAGCGDLAIDHWLQAGQLALRKSANAEALQHFEQGLELLKDLPDSCERASKEQVFQVSIGTALTASYGYAAPQVERAYRRAQQLGEQSTNSPQHFWIDAGLVVFRLVRGEVGEAGTMARRLLEMAEGQGDEALVAAASCIRGTVTFFNGEFNAALGWCDRAIELADMEDHAFREHGGCDLDTTAHTFAALSLWHLGFADTALRRAHQARETCRGQAYAQAFTSILAGVELRYFRREQVPVLELSREVMSLCDEHGFQLWYLQAVLFHSWAALQDDGKHSAEALARNLGEMQEALQHYRATGSQLALPMFLGLVAETQLALGRLEQARTLLEEAFDLVERGQNRWWEPELHRLYGELLLAAAAQGGRELGAAEEPLQRALAAAERQGSKALQLRAALSLARGLGAHSDTSDRGSSLSRLYQTFTEGFSTPDLLDARAFIEGRN